MIDRRAWIAHCAKALAGAAWLPDILEAAPRLRITTLELLPMRATARTVWLFVRLGTDAGLTGLGEASDAFGFANTSKQNAAQMESELRAIPASSKANPLSKLPRIVEKASASPPGEG